MAEQSSGTTQTSTAANHWFLSAAVALVVIGLLWIAYNTNSTQREIRETERQDRLTERFLSQAWYCQIENEAMSLRRVEIIHNSAERFVLKIINPLTVTDMTYLYDEDIGVWSRRDGRDFGTFSLQANEASERRLLGTYTSSKGGTNTFAVGPDRNDCVYILQHGL